jgi:2-dehydropantoate 2-reductase
MIASSATVSTFAALAFEGSAGDHAGFEHGSPAGIPRIGRRTPRDARLDPVRAPHGGAVRLDRGAGRGVDRQQPVVLGLGLEREHAPRAVPGGEQRERADVRADVDDDLAAHVERAVFAVQDVLDDQGVPAPGAQCDFGIVRHPAKRRGSTPMTTERREHAVAVMGAGAVGGYYGGMLALSGVPVTLIGRARHADAIRAGGLVIERAERRDVARVNATTDASGVRDAGVVLVCVKSPDTRAAALAMKPHLRDDATVVSLQNGVSNADVLAEVLGQVVLAAVVWVGTVDGGRGRRCATAEAATWHSASRARAQHGATPRNARADIGAMFERAGVRCPVVDDVDAALWEKLVVNCAFNAVSALGRSRYGRMARDGHVRGLMEAAVREAVAVARAAGVALDEAAMMATVWRTAERLAMQHSSTAQDIVRGKPTEIDMLNGEVVRRGEALGVPVPVNRTLHALVRFARRRRRPRGLTLGARWATVRSMASAPAAIWSRTAYARRFGREILILIVLKIVLLTLLWWVAIKPLPRVEQSPAAVAKHLVPQTAPAPARP